MSQGSLANPTTGTLSGLTAVSTDNGSADALNTENSGATAPTNQLSGSPSAGNHWLDTSVAAKLVRKLHDGASWLVLGSVDTVNHIWEPVLGGGAGSLAAAATVDLGSISEAFVTITGTGSISSFGASAPIGSLKGITFAVAGAVLVASANMILQGGRNIPVNAGDAALCWQIGAGTWLVFFSRANGLAPVITPVTAVRQTVQSGPGGGVPSFLPATSASLGLTSANISSSSPLTVSAASGFGPQGQSDVIGQATANLTWSGLSASQTSYLGVTVVAGALTPFSTTLQPLYQFGGSISVANGQYTFDYSQMAMFVGNGTTATNVAAVFLGECVAGSSSITSTIAYAYNGYYDSGWVPTLPASYSEISLSANLGTTVAVSEFQIQCLSAENGYNVGDTAVPLNFYNSGDLYAAFRWLTRTTAGFTVGAGGFNATTVNKTTGTTTTPTLANWAYRLIVKRSF